MTNAYVLNGTLTDAQTVRLSEPLPVQAGDEVRLTVEVVRTARPRGNAANVLAVLAKIREEQRLSGHVPMTKEEIDAYIKGERDSWGDD